MTTLYKKNKDKVQQWTIEVVGNQYRSIEGFVGGAMTTSQWTTAIGKNIGKKNQVSPEAQAVKEAEAKIKLKLEKGYTLNSNGETEVKFEPMLAHSYADQKDKITFPCYVQPKLDGMRAPTNCEGAKSRLGKPINAIPHIINALAPVFEKYPGIILDGELYNHELRDDFNRLISLVKKNREGTEAIEFHVYDVFLPHAADTLFDDRFEELAKVVDGIPGVCLVYTAKVNNEVELDEFYELFLSQGYEGMMIRNNTPYVQKRTNNLLKRKEFVDGEYVITDIIEGIGNRSGMMGKIVMVTPEGESFEADGSGLGGHEVYKEMLEKKEEYIGKQATVKYQNLTPDRRVPRFGKVVAIRDYE